MYSIIPKKDFGEGNLNSEGVCSLEDFYSQRNPDSSFVGAAAEEGERNLFDTQLSRDGNEWTEGSGQVG